MSEAAKKALVKKARKLHEQEQSLQRQAYRCTWNLAECLYRLNAEFGMSQADISRAMGWRGRSNVGRYIAMWRDHSNRRSDPNLSPWELVRGESPTSIKDMSIRSNARRLIRDAPEEAAEIFAKEMSGPSLDAWARSGRRFIVAIERSVAQGHVANDERNELIDALEDVADACLDALCALRGVRVGMAA